MGHCGHRFVRPGLPGGGTRLEGPWTRTGRRCSAHARRYFRDVLPRIARCSDVGTHMPQRMEGALEAGDARWTFNLH